MTKTEKYSLDRPSLWVAVISALLIIVIVTVGVLTKIFLDEFTARVTLISCILLVCIIGMSALIFLELRKKKVQKYNKSVTQKNNYYYQNIQPSAPEESLPGYKPKDDSTS